MFVSTTKAGWFSPRSSVNQKISLHDAHPGPPGLRRSRRWKPASRREPRVVALDTNVVVSLIVRDDAVQAKRR
jgi:hypothetical protein